MARVIWSPQALADLEAVGTTWPERPPAYAQAFCVDDACRTGAFTENKTYRLFMNLRTQIRPELWQSVASTYSAENYSHAVLDAMHHLSDVLRDKSGLDGDGTTLVGQALGGSSPRIMITRMQTETEKNVQSGIQQILRGLYQGVRNPRSHEQAEDDKKTNEISDPLPF